MAADEAEAQAGGPLEGIRIIELGVAICNEGPCDGLQG
jgi:hypothetical protein